MYLNERISSSMSLALSVNSTEPISVFSGFEMKFGMKKKGGLFCSLRPTQHITMTVDIHIRIVVFYRISPI